MTNLKGFRPIAQVRFIAVIEKDGKTTDVEVKAKVELGRYKDLVRDLKAGYRQLTKSGVIVPTQPGSNILDPKKS